MIKNIDLGYGQCRDKTTIYGLHTALHRSAHKATGSLCLIKCILFALPCINYNREYRVLCLILTSDTLALYIFIGSVDQLVESGCFSEWYERPTNENVSIGFRSVRAWNRIHHIP